VTGDAPGFPSKRELAERYVELTGRDVEPVAWFEALALWKASVFCEAIYGRFKRGELTPEDSPVAASLEHVVPTLAGTALDLLG
jgi:aminoglycoside phosphotransferase (APT) family kinase protein